MSKLVAKPTTIRSWVLGTIGWSVGGLLGLLPLLMVGEIAKELLGLSEEVTESLLWIGILGVHLWLWWQVLLLVGFQVMCLVVTLSIQDEWQHRTMWYT